MAYDLERVDLGGAEPQKFDRWANVKKAWRGLWLLPTSAEGTLFLGACAVVGLRLVGCVQLVLALPGSVASASAPVADVLVAGAFFVQSVWVVRTLLRRRTPVLPLLCCVDTATVSLVLLSQLWWAPPGDSYSTWEAWGFGISMSTVLLISIGVSRFRYALVGAAALAGSYLIGVLGDARAAGATVTVVTNALGLFANVLVARFVWRFLQRAAVDADRARTRAERARVVAEEARAEAERAHGEAEVARAEAVALRTSERKRLEDYLHDHKTMLMVIHEWEQIARDEELRSATRERARRAVNWARAFIDGVAEPGAAETLAGALRQVRGEFTQLSVVVVAELVDSLTLDREVLDDVESVVRTLLVNVESHAKAREVTLYGGLLADGSGWEVSVHDDGLGFDLDRVAWGHGWRSQIPDAVARLGGKVEARRLDPGTLVTVVVPFATPGHEAVTA